MKNPFLFLLFLAAITYSCQLLDPNGGGVITIDELEVTSEVTFSVSPCDNGVEMLQGDLPRRIVDYLNTELPDANIRDIELFQREGTSVFGVRLNNDIEILFDIHGQVISFSDDDDEQNIALADLPAAVNEYLAANFPDLTIDHAETELEYGESYIEVYLSDGTELYFDRDGVFLCGDDHGNDDNDWNDNSNDDNSDDDNGDEGSSDDDSDSVPVGNLPVSITDYVSANYSGYVIKKAKTEDLCNDRKVYEVELEKPNESNEPHLYFDLDGTFLFVSTDISAGDLPAAVTAALETGYPDYQFIAGKIERHDYPDGTVHYEVKIEKGDDEVELVFAADGTILCRDRSGNDDSGNDDDGHDDNGSHGNDDNGGDDDDNVSVSGLPMSIRNYVTANYPGYSIQKAKKEDLCNDQEVYEVDLERENDSNEPDLYFDLSGNFLFAATDIAAGDLPAAVTAAIQSKYPGYTFISDKIERHDYPDGSVQYEVRIEKANDDVKVVLAADGNILCRD